MDFVVARALEFFVDHVVHARARVNERGADNRERAAFFDVAGRAEDALGPFECVGVDAAREHLARRRDYLVVGAGKTRDGIEQNHDVALGFSEALSFFDHHFGDLYVAHRRFIESGGDNFAADGALHFRHFFRTFIDEKHHEDGVGIVG